MFALFEQNPDLRGVAVVRDGTPLGMISRYDMIDNMARPYRHELYGRKSCTRFMDAQPLIVDLHQTIDRLLAGGRDGAIAWCDLDHSTGFGAATRAHSVTSIGALGHSPNSSGR